LDYAAALKVSDLRDSLDEASVLVADFTAEARATFGEALLAMDSERLQRAVAAGAVSGLVVCEDGDALGLALFLAGKGEGQIHFFHVARAGRGRGLEGLLVASCTERLLSEGVHFLVCETLILGDEPAVAAAFAAHGYDRIPRMLMSLDLPGGMPRPESPAGYELRSWDEQYLPAAAALVHEASFPDGDARVSRQLRTVEGAEAMIRSLVKGSVGAFDHEGSLMALRNEAVCGVLFFVRRGPAEGFIPEIAVSADHRGRGLGRALMKSALSTAAKGGIKTVKLGVTCDNKPAVALYSGLGFRPQVHLCAYVRVLSGD